jgi:hypothetical protein
MNYGHTLRKWALENLVTNEYVLLTNGDNYYVPSMVNEVLSKNEDFIYFDLVHSLNIYLNNPEANKENLWDKFDFDEHYLVDHHVRNLLPYLSIDNDKTSIRFRVYDTNFDVIITNDI